MWGRSCAWAYLPFHLDSWGTWPRLVPAVSLSGLWTRLALAFLLGQGGAGPEALGQLRAQGRTGTHVEENSSTFRCLNNLLGVFFFLFLTFCLAVYFYVVGL